MPKATYKEHSKDLPRKEEEEGRGVKRKLTLGSICVVLCSNPPTPISVELLLKTPPHHVVARNTSSVVRLCAPTTTTRSPAFNPLATSAAASLPAPSRSSRHVTCLTSTLPSRTSVTATSSSRLMEASLERRKFSAMLMRTPWNQRGRRDTGMDSSTTVA